MRGTKADQVPAALRQAPARRARPPLLAGPRGYFVLSGASYCIFCNDHALGKWPGSPPFSRAGLCRRLSFAPRSERWFTKSTRRTGRQPPSRCCWRWVSVTTGHGGSRLLLRETKQLTSKELHNSSICIESIFYVNYNMSMPTLLLSSVLGLVASGPPWNQLTPP